jgi:hypothetical protein
MVVPKVHSGSGWNAWGWAPHLGGMSEGVAVFFGGPVLDYVIFCHTTCKHSIEYGACGVTPGWPGIYA